MRSRKEEGEEEHLVVSMRALTTSLVADSSSLICLCFLWSSSEYLTSSFTSSDTWGWRRR